MTASTIWHGTRVLVTGGAGFIGGRLVERLLERGAQVTVADDFSKGSEARVAGIAARQGLHLGNGDRAPGTGPRLRLLVRDLTDPGQAAEALRDQEVIFHLAATIGGRGFIDERPADCTRNLSLNHTVISQAHRAGVRHLHYASSACVYPLDLQARYDSDYLLREEDAPLDGPAACDGAYGWSKFMGEVVLQAYHRQYGMTGSVCRYVTAYGPWEDDSHAVIALIKRAVERHDPYVIWGTGEQDRDFTYVDDIVEGSMRAAEVVRDGTPLNLGTSVRYKIKQVAQMIFALVGWTPREVVFDPTRPSGVLSRALDISRAEQVLGWRPGVPFPEGLRRTVAWCQDAFAPAPVASPHPPGGAL